MHTPATTVEANKPLKITAQITGPEFPDSVIIYTDKISFWNDHNPSVKMQRTNGYTYQATIPAEEIKEGYFRYNIIVCRGDSTRTYPAGSSATGSSSGTNGNPLDWDYTLSQYWTTRVVAPGSAIQLLTVTDTHSRIEAYTLPEWNELHRSLTDSSPTEKPLLRFTFTSKGENPQYFLRTFVKDKIDGRKGKIKDCTVLCIRVNRAKALPEGISAGFVTSDGYTYKSPCPSPSPEGIIRIPLNRFASDRHGIASGSLSRLPETVLPAGNGNTLPGGENRKAGNINAGQCQTGNRDRAWRDLAGMILLTDISIK